MGVCVCVPLYMYKYFSFFSSTAHRTLGLPAVVQTPDSLPDTVSRLLLEQAEAQLSTEAEGTPTRTWVQSLDYTRRPFFSHNKYILKDASWLAGRCDSESHTQAVSN